jgi:hypothetical protein
VYRLPCRLTTDGAVLRVPGQKEQNMIKPDIHAVHLAAHWAQQIGLPPGNLWEPAISRLVLREYRELVKNNDAPEAHVWAFIEGLYTRQLGIDRAEAHA